ncbi:MAG TPA: PQ-loop domain-containing transporter, partial [Propionibacteriaceae bacterium]|nr:PQ-loop domain-containing transporter [Propionibacteriaceae bacterium]
MTFVEIWGWICAAVTATLSLPQLLRLLKVRTSAGLSLLSWQMMLAANIPWVAHGILDNRPNLAIPNAILFVCTILILRMIRADRGLGLLETYALGAVAGAVGVTVDVVFGAAAFGALVTIPQATGQLAQLRDLLRLRDIRGLSWVFLTVSFLLQFMWISWAFMVDDNAVKVAGSMMAVLASAN